MNRLVVRALVAYLDLKCSVAVLHADVHTMEVHVQHEVKALLLGHVFLYIVVPAIAEHFGPRAESFVTALKLGGDH